jgi:hypothetical protein
MHRIMPGAPGDERWLVTLYEVSVRAGASAECLAQVFPQLPSRATLTSDLRCAKRLFRDMPAKEWEAVLVTVTDVVSRACEKIWAHRQQRVVSGFG